MIKKRNPFLAFLLAIVPGLGQLYNGQVKKAGIIVLIDFILIAFIYYTQIFMSVAGIIILMTLLVGTILYRLIDAFIVAKKAQHYELKRYNNWYTYLLFIGFCIMFHAILDANKTNTVQSFNIPSSGMEPAISVGDRIIVQGGFYNNHAVVRNDLIVFYYPAELNKPIDEKTHYINRCIAIPGDTLSVINKQLYINGLPSIIPSELKHKFKCYTKNILSQRKKEELQKDYNIHSQDIYGSELLSHNGKSLYLIDLSTENVKKLRVVNIFDSIVDFKVEELDQNAKLFPYASKSQRWTADDYGAVWIPKAGVTIKLDSNIVELYAQTIKNYEGHKSVEAVNEKLIINGEPVSEYTFKQNYYFMMGDNRHNTADSRYWGFVPKDHIFGKAWLLFYSYDPNSDNFRKEHFLTPIK